MSGYSLPHWYAQESYTDSIIKLIGCEFASRGFARVQQYALIGIRSRTAGVQLPITFLTPANDWNKRGL